jgi:hypothetical protein
MTITDVLSGLKVIAAYLPTPAGPFISGLAELGAEVVELAKGTPDTDELALLATLRRTLRAGLTAELQAAIDASS